MDPTPDKLAKIALLLFAKRAELALEEERDEEVALRKALLVLAALSQDNQSEAAQQFLRYILTSFQPLLTHLEGWDHEIWDRHNLGIRADVDGKPLVAVNRETVEALVEEFGRGDLDIPQEALLRITGSSESEEITVPWSITENRFVGFFDIMGFASLVGKAHNDHCRLYRVMEGLYDAARLAEKIAARGNEDEQVVFQSQAPSGKLRTAQFSDSIIAITENEDDASSLLILLASQILFLHALKHGVILRGAIARGTITADFARSIFFGQPIVDAFRLEEAQQWYGIAVHPSAELKGSYQAPNLGENEIPIDQPFDVKLKGREGPEQLNVINWPVLFGSMTEIEARLKPFDGTGPEQPDKLREYHSATLDFCRKMWSKYRH